MKENKVISISGLLRVVDEFMSLKNGLVKSYPIDTVLKLIQGTNYFKPMRIGNFSESEANTMLSIRICTSIFYPDGDIPLDKLKQDIRSFMQILNQSGYCIAGIDDYDSFKKLSNVNDLYFILTHDRKEHSIWIEPKYDAEIIVTRLPKLYHVTANAAWQKIRKMGLSPKSQSKKAGHPDRVYLTTTKKHAIKLAGIFQHFDDNADVMLEIDTDGMKPPRYRFFADPDTENGIYTYSNIEPGRIKVVSSS